MPKDYRKYLSRLFAGKEDQALTKEVFAKYDLWASQDPPSLDSFLQYYNGLLPLRQDAILGLLNRSVVTMRVLRGSALEEFVAKALKPVSAQTGYEHLRDQNILAWMGFIYDEGHPNVERSFQRADLSFAKKVSVAVSGRAFDVWIPKLVIECKSHIDKTQLRSVAQEANDFRSIFPELVFFLVALNKGLRAVDEKVIGRQSIDRIVILKHEEDVKALRTAVREVLQS
jgi:hypothetical protein